MSGYRGFDGLKWKGNKEIEQNKLDTYKEYVR